MVWAATAVPALVRLTVTSQGEVDAQYMIDLVSERQRNLVEVASAFVAAGYFFEGDALLEVEATDCKLPKIRAVASVAETQEELEAEKSEADLASKGVFPLREAKVYQPGHFLRKLRGLAVVVAVSRL